MTDGGAARIAVVTGGTGALGRWVTRGLLEAGCRVHVPWIDAGEVDALVAFTNGAGGGLALERTDVTSPADVGRFFDGVQADHGRLDVLCNLVGGFDAGALEETSPEMWDRMMRLNAGSAFLCARAAVPLMKAARGGRVVNVTALPALQRGAAGMSAYAASKAAVLSLTHSLARELRPDRISVNAIAPEILDTAANRAAMPSADPSGWVTPAAAAEAILFLAMGEGSGTVTGSVIELRKR